MKPTINVGLGNMLGSDGSVTVLLHLLQAVIAANLEYLARNPRTPKLYSAGVRYQRERGTEEWRGIAQVLAAGNGDCEDLASWRAAELVHAGEAASIAIVWRKDAPPGARTYHVLVRREDGRLEDPSGRLGMPHGIETEVS